MKKLEGILFDLDGVVADTAKYHFAAWQKVATKVDINLEEEFEEELKGIDRATSFQKILDYGNKEIDQETFDKLLVEKNNDYLEFLEELNESDILPGIKNLIVKAKDKGIKIAIASVSKNAPYILEKLGLMQYIDYIANPDEVKDSKPAPDIFLKAAEGINVIPECCVGIEDSRAGIEAINRAGIKSVGVVDGLKDADLKYSLTNQIKLEDLEQLIK